jgi:hypothetical protein
MIKVTFIAFSGLLEEFSYANKLPPVDYSQNGKNWGENYPLCLYGQE